MQHNITDYSWVIKYLCVFLRKSPGHAVLKKYCFLTIELEQFVPLVCARLHKAGKNVYVHTVRVPAAVMWITDILLLGMNRINNPRCSVLGVWYCSQEHVNRAYNQVFQQKDQFASIHCSLTLATSHECSHSVRAGSTDSPRRRLLFHPRDTQFWQWPQLNNEH